MSKEYSCRSIFRNITSEYIDYCNSLEEVINIYCQKNTNFGKLIKLLFNNYEIGTENYYMKEGFTKIINYLMEEDTFPIMYKKIESYSNTIHTYNPIEEIFNFIKLYIQMSDNFKGCFNTDYIKNDRYVISVKLTMDENDEIKIEENECYKDDVLEDGYVNTASGYVKFLKKYAKVKMENNRKGK